MSRHPAVRFVALSCVVALFAGFSAAAGARTGESRRQVTASSGTLVLNPATDLRNGQLVQVNAPGLTPDSAYALYECRAADVGTENCFDLLPWVFSADDGNLFQQQFTVWSQQAFPNGTTDCAGAPGACEIRLLQGDAAVATAPLDFDPSPPSPPSVTAAPNSTLANGDVVSLDGSGFPAGQGVALRECVTGTDACGYTWGTATADGSGVLHAQFTVARGILNQWSPPGYVTDCATPGACEVRVIYGAGYSVSAPIVFAATAYTTPWVVATPVSGIADHQMVTIAAGGFAPGETVVVGECAPVLDFQRYCSPYMNGGFTADPAGEVHTTIMAFRKYNQWNPGYYASADCAATSSSCIIMAKADDDMLRSAVVPMTFDPSATAASSLEIAPRGPWFEGQSVAVAGQGYTPPVVGPSVYAQYWLLECTSEGPPDAAHCQAPAGVYDVGVNGDIAATVVLTATFTTETGEAVNCWVPGSCRLVARMVQDPSVAGSVALSFAPLPRFTG